MMAHGEDKKMSVCRSSFSKTVKSVEDFVAPLFSPSPAEFDALLAPPFGGGELDTLVLVAPFGNRQEAASPEGTVPSRCQCARVEHTEALMAVGDCHEDRTRPPDEVLATEE